MARRPLQAQFVGGIPLVVVMVGASSGKLKRRSRTFTIRFLPKRGLTLVWSKRESLVLACVTEVALGAPISEPSTPRAGRNSFVAALGAGSSSSGKDAAVDPAKAFCLAYSGSAATPGTSSPRTSRDLAPAAASGKPGEATSNLVLEADSEEKRNHLARCFRRLAHQERERSSFLT